MINPKLVRELQRAIANKRYEETPSGILFPTLNVHAGGLFETSLNGQPWEPGLNMVPTLGLNNCLNAFLGGSGFNPEDAWYFAPFATNTAPTLSLTAANFTATQTEFTNYAEGARQLWTPAAAVGGVITNAATQVTITIGSGGQTAIYGLALLSASAKSATTGVLAACALLASARTGLQVGDILGERYSLTLANAS